MNSNDNLDSSFRAISETADQIRASCKRRKILAVSVAIIVSIIEIVTTDHISAGFAVVLGFLLGEYVGNLSFKESFASSIKNISDKEITDE